MFCIKCGSEIADDSKFCPKCGELISPEIEVEQQQETVQETVFVSQPIPTAEPVEKKKKNILGYVGVLLLLVLLAGGGVFVYQKINANKLEDKTETTTMEQTAETNELALVSANDEVESTVDTAEMNTEENVTEAQQGNQEDVSTNEANQTGEVILYQSADYDPNDYVNSSNDTSDTSDSSTVEKEEYLLPNSDTEYITKSDLKNFDATECRLARNEIYARHGRKFKDDEVQDHFDSCSWYEGTIEPDDFPESMLSECEIKNRDLIVSYEKEKGYR